MDDNLYTRLAKAGWLGTKAEVSAKYGHPVWKNEDEDPYKQALLNQRKQKPPSDDSGGA